MDQILEQAEKLGRMIALNERTAMWKQIQKQVAADPATAAIIQGYQGQYAKLQKLQAENQPIEVEDKHLLQELEQKMMTSESVKELTRRQMEFVELMKKVKEAIDNQLGLEEVEDEDEGDDEE
ncbi:MAG: YlbF family regulator [Phycisphaerae bacterium]|nr:YlbF family regulator [Phycisphaerae bacterium]